MQIEMFASSDVGLKRELNEDSFLILEREGIVAVGDGMGGHNAGEVASKMVVHTIATYFKKAKLPDVSYSSLPAYLPYLAKDLVVAIRLANRRIFQDAHANSLRAGMGTTVAAIVFGGNVACIAHVGDSRVYRLRNTELQQLTVDHTPMIEFSQERGFTMEEAQKMGMSNIITRALGTKPATAIDVRLEEVELGDTFLVCSDGLYSMVSEQVICDIMLHTDSIDTAARQLIEAANMAGGKDNITAAIARVKHLDLLSISLQNPGVVFTIPEEKTRIQEKEDRLIAALFHDTPTVPRGGSVWLKLVSALSLTIIVVVLFLFLSKKIPGLLSQRIKPNEEQKSQIQAEDSLENDSDRTLSNVVSIDDVRLSGITGHIFLEVFPFSDSVANAYEIAVDGELVSSFAELRQSGLILTSGEHTLEVCLNGAVIYSKRVTVTEDGQELEPLSLESVIEQ